jgi:glycosyltransferase involved in cell wall biosynthesis
VKVSLIATVKDAGPAVEAFLGSIREQTRRPDEVVVVDGGSTDGTLEVLRRADDLTLIEEPGAGIGRGRNIAVRAATHDVVAVSDADCVLDPSWLERILEPLERGAEVAAGAYRPVAPTFWQVCASAHVPDPEEMKPGWLPSSRSLAFRREVFEAAGGYPEWLDIGEDMYLNHRWVQRGVRIELAPKAVAYWRLRPTLIETWRQYARYAEGDALGRMYPNRHALRFVTYLAASGVVASRRPSALAAGTVAGAIYVAKPVRRAWRRLPRGVERPMALAGVPAMTAFIDAAKMWGYLRGMRRMARP